MPITEYTEGQREYVRAYLPGADRDRDIKVTLVGNELRLRFQHRVENLECQSTAEHCVTFHKVLHIPAGTTPDDVAAEYVEGVVWISWPAVAPLAPGRAARRADRPKCAVDLGSLDPRCRPEQELATVGPRPPVVA